MAKGMPGQELGQGSFFEVRADRTVKLRPEEMNGRYAPVERQPVPITFRRRAVRRPTLTGQLSRAL